MSKGAGKGNIFWIIVIAIVGVIGFFFLLLLASPVPAGPRTDSALNCEPARRLPRQPSIATITIVRHRAPASRPKSVMPPP
jgi:hypothetical protein